MFDVSALTAGSFTVATGQTLNAGSTSVFANDVVGNIINSGGTLTAAGIGAAGTLTIGGNLTLSGGTVNLDLANVTTVGGAVNDLVKSTNLTLTGTTSLAINKLNGVLVSSGSYTLFNYTGTLTGDQSNLTLSGAAGGVTRQTFGIDTISTPGSVLLNVAGSTANLTWVGDGAANAWDIATTVNWTGAADLNNKYYDGDVVTIDDSGSNATPIALGVTVQPGFINVNNTSKDFEISGGGNIAGFGSLTKNGNGKLTISTSNGFTGAVAINAGTVSVSTVANGSTASGLGAGTTISLGDATHTGTLQYTGATATTNRTVTLGDGGGVIDVTSSGTTLTDSGGFTGTGALTKVGNGALTISAPINTTGPITVNAGTMTASGAISNTSGVIVNGGALTISAAGTYFSGATVNNGGTLTVTTTGGATGLGSGDTVVNAGGTLIGGVGDSFGYTLGVSPNTIHIIGGTVTDLATANYRVTLPNLEFTGGTLTSAVGNAGDANGNYSFFGKGGTATITTNSSTDTSVISATKIGVQSPTTFNVAAGSVTGGATPGVDLLVSSILAPSGVQPVTKTGAGVLEMTSANTYLGATNINQGTLVLAGSGSLSSTVTTVASGAIFDVSAVAGGYNQPTGRALTIAPGGLVVGPTTFVSGATLTGGRLGAFANDVTGDVTSGGTVNVATTGTAGTLTLGNALTLNSASLLFDLATDNTTGNGINDLISVGGNLTLTGTTTVAVNQLSTLTTGSYTLLTYAGSLSGSAGNLFLTSPTPSGRRSYAFDTTTTAGSVLLNVIGAPASLVWNGDNATNPWDTTSTVWKNGGSPDKFYSNDNVLIDDTGSNSPVINLSTSILPGSVVVNNTSKDYTLSGAGAIVGTTGITKNGNGKLTISTANNFTGAVAINAGTVSVATVALNGTASPLGSGTAISLGDASNTGSLQYTGATATINRTLTLGGGGGAIEVATAGQALTASGAISGTGSLNKLGNGELILSNSTSSFSGNVVVSAGTLTAGGPIPPVNSTGPLGAVNFPGRSITVNNGATLSFTINNVFGSGFGNANLPAILLNGSTLTSTHYNVLGDLTLLGATLTQASNENGSTSYEGYQFRGNVTVAGAAPSTIATTNGRADHLGPNTTFDVSDVTGSSAADLTISAPLRNQSGDFGLAAGMLTKTGNGTLLITGAQSYSALDNVAGRTILDTSLANATITGDGGTLVLNASANNSTVNVNNSNSTYFTVSQTLAALNIGDGGVATLGSPLPLAPTALLGVDLGGGNLAGASLQGVPEPGSAALLFGGLLTLLGFRRRH